MSFVVQRIIDWFRPAPTTVERDQHGHGSFIFSSATLDTFTYRKVFAKWFCSCLLFIPLEYIDPLLGISSSTVSLSFDQHRISLILSASLCDKHQPNTTS